jgi:hypothetical protein
MVKDETSRLYQCVAEAKRGSSHESEAELWFFHEMEKPYMHTMSVKHPSAVDRHDIWSIGFLVEKMDDECPPRMRHATGSGVFAYYLTIPNASSVAWDARRAVI